jgi:hypothetical protein
LSLEYSTSPATVAAAKSSTTTAVSSTANLPPLPQAAMV